MLFDSLQLGALRLPNRVVMAPLTRSRAGRSHIPNALMAEHYAQRASAGLLIAEATMVASDACAFTGEPGIFDEACAAGWRQVTDAVHAAGGRIALQIWHPGRSAHSSLNGGVQPVSSGGTAIQGLISTPEGKQPYEVPRPLRDDELPGIVDLFAQATRRALEAGFDGVQVHGAHGYLIDQFLRDGVNHRAPPYGGSMANRARLLLDVLDACIHAAGANRVGLRISPLSNRDDLMDSDPAALVAFVATELERRGLQHFELRHLQHDAPAEEELAAIARRHYSGVLMRNGGFDSAAAAETALANGADAIVFGRPFIANPDLVARLQHGLPMAAYDPARLYGGGAEGYTDYPAYRAEPVASA